MKLCVVKTAVILLAAITIPLYGQTKLKPVHFKGNAQIEVGGPYVGIEMHHSLPSLQRISFYYPTANSIDLSTDYWKRDTSFISSMGLKIGNGKRERIGFEPFEYDITPYNITFRKSDSQKSISISYRFSGRKPAMFIIYELTNNSRQAQVFEFDTHLEASVKTSHTFALKDKAWTEYEPVMGAIFVNFEVPETQNVQLFAANATEMPTAWHTRSNGQVFNTEAAFGSLDLQGRLIPKSEQSRPAIKYLYRRSLAPSEKMTIVQIVGSCKKNEGRDLVSYLMTNYQKEIDDFENTVNSYIFKTGSFKTGDVILDKSYGWAKAILNVNRHYIDGTISPMPCPAEYNFYFSHDVFLTDLAAVNFDLPRVKQDLEFTMKHADTSYIIPHAYYWKDSTYKVEPATPDNWNHFWFIIMSASYLRHSGDRELLTRLYPYLSKSVTEGLINNKDNLIWAYRPDWWDIGHNFGPRAFMSILAAKALKDYTYICTGIGKTTNLTQYEQTSDAIEKELNSKLWDDSLKYLINYFVDGSKDKHYYIGSLPAADFNLLSLERTKQMVETAQTHLLDKKIGIYTVFPMDFHKLIAYLQFAGNEAGDPYLYINGGVWSHGNTFYALALKAAGRRTEALDFIKRVMTIDGIMDSPNGQPAMYEYRIANPDDPLIYGKVDKPQFMWAAGFYIYNLYHLLGIDENPWNISFTPYLGKEQKSCSFSLNTNGHSVLVNLTGHGEYIRSIQYDNKTSASAVIPVDNKVIKKITIQLGAPIIPYLSKTEAVVHSAEYKRTEKKLILSLNAFPSHKNTVEVISPGKPAGVFQGKETKSVEFRTEKVNNVYRTIITIIHKSGTEELSIKF